MDKNKKHNLRKAIMLAERMGLKKTTTIFEGLDEAGAPVDLDSLKQQLADKMEEEAYYMEDEQGFYQARGGPLEDVQNEIEELRKQIAKLEGDSGGLEEILGDDTGRSDLGGNPYKGEKDPDHPEQTCNEAHGDDPGPEGHAKWKEQSAAQELAEAKIRQAVRKVLSEGKFDQILKKKVKKLTEANDVPEESPRDYLKMLIQKHNASGHADPVRAATDEAMGLRDNLKDGYGLLQPYEKSWLANFERLIGVSSDDDASEEDMKALEDYMAKELEGDVKKSREMKKHQDEIEWEKRKRDPRDRMNLTGLEPDTETYEKASAKNLRRFSIRGS